MANSIVLDQNDPINFHKLKTELDSIHTKLVDKMFQVRSLSAIGACRNHCCLDGCYITGLFSVLSDLNLEINIQVELLQKIEHELLNDTKQRLQKKEDHK